jgi:aminoglycoside phosphotransferase (APT) family kinase protein
VAAIDEDLAELGSNVARAASDRYPDHRLTDLTVLPGGHSGLTHVATFATPADEVRVVVKSAPPGRAPRGRHDVLRQARILRALNAWGRVSVPEVLFWADTPAHLFGMRMVDGLAAEPVMEHPRPGERAEGVLAAWHGAVDLLVTMQQATPADLGLEDEPVVSPEEELERWKATMISGRLDSDRRATDLAERLAAWRPASRPPCLVHGDYRLGNMLQHDGVIAALVDWEIWTVGDPRSDLGWLAIFADATNFPGFGRAAPGTPAADEVVERYLAVSGSGPEGVAWFRALACFKLAAIQAHNLRRHLEGRYHDPHQERLVESTGALLDRGLRLLA